MAESTYTLGMSTADYLAHRRTTTAVGTALNTTRAEPTNAAERGADEEPGDVRGRREDVHLPQPQKEGVV